MIQNASMKKLFFIFCAKKIMTWLIITCRNPLHIFQANGRKYLPSHSIQSIYCLKKFKRNTNFNNFYNYTGKIKLRKVSMINCLRNGPTGNQTVSMTQIWHSYKFCRAGSCFHNFCPINLALIRKCLFGPPLTGWYKHQMEWLKKVFWVELRLLLKRP